LKHFIEGDSRGKGSQLTGKLRGENGGTGKGRIEFQNCKKGMDLNGGKSRLCQWFEMKK
jgi:hypothetical protein